MKRIVPISACATVLLVFLAAPLESQVRDAQVRPATHERAFSVEVRGGYGFPLGDFSDDMGAESDFGIGAVATFMFTPSFGIHAGWARDIFDCEACSGSDRIHVSGWEGGATFLVPSRRGISPWVRAGAIWHSTSFEFQTGGVETDREWGFQGAVGFDVPLGEMFSISPGVRYNTVSPTVEFPTDSPINVEAGTVQYVSLDVALKFHLPRH